MSLLIIEFLICVIYAFAFGMFTMWAIRVYKEIGEDIKEMKKWIK
jgi:hypothetical protein